MEETREQIKDELKKLQEQTETMELKEQLEETRAKVRRKKFEKSLFGKCLKMIKGDWL